MLLTWPQSSGLNRPVFSLGFKDLGSGLVDTSSQGIAVAPTYTRATVAQALKSDGTFVQVASGSARSWYSNTGLLALGYMAEGARTNRCVQSQNFGADWVAIGTPTRSGGTTVLGSVQLDTIGDDSGAALEGYSLPVTFVGDAVKSCGIFMKAGTSTSSALRLRDGTASADRLLAVVTWAGTVPTVTMTTGTDLTGTVSAAQLGTSGVYWIKFATTSVTAASANQLEVYPATDAALSVGATGTVQVGVVNEEDATFPSSPIITTVGAVTRNADVLSYPTSPWLNASAGTLFTQFTPIAASSAANLGHMFSLDDTTVNERTVLRLANDGSGTGQLVVVDGGVTQAAISLQATVAGTTYKIAGVYATNDFAASQNGGTVGTDVVGTLPTVTQAEIGCQTGGGQLFGAISSISYFARRLPDSALISLTT